MINGGKSYEFGEFVLDVTHGELLRKGEYVPIPPKVLETLVVLIERQGSVVSKTEMMSALWPDTFVEEANLTQNIFTLRKILGESNGIKFIETVPRRGYKFAADVRAMPMKATEIVLKHDTRTRVVVEPGRTQVSAGFLIAIGSGLLLTAAVAIGVVFLWPRLTSTRRTPTTPIAAAPQVSIRRLTYQGGVYHAGISPDGKYLAYDLRIDTDDGPKESLVLQNISTGSVAQVMPPVMPGYSGVTFSPDGNYLYFGTGRKDVKNGIIARIPVLGGTPQEVVTNVWSAFSLSPDGRELAFVRGYPTKDPPQALIVANVSDGQERELAVNRWQGQREFHGWESAPAWSADGRSIAVAGAANDDKGSRGALFEVKVANGAASEIATPRWAAIHQVAWLNDGLVVSAQEKDSDPVQLWHVPYPAGAPRRLTNDLSNYGRITVTADSNSVAVQQASRISHVWSVADGHEARQLTSGSVSDGHLGLDISPQGRVVFVSNRSGEFDLWAMETDGTGVRQLTAKTGGRNRAPIHTRDGRYLVFDSYRSGQSQIWRTDTNGNNPLQLTYSVASSPAVSSDSRWVYYINWSRSPTVIERVSIDGGDPLQVTNGKYAAGYPSLSPDGRLLAHTFYDEENGWRVAVIPAGGGDPIKLFDHAAQHVVRWTPDSSAFVFIKPVAGNQPGPNLWRQPITGGAAIQLTKFGPKEDPITNFAIAPDGKQLVIARGRVYSDVVLLSNVR